MTRNWKTKFTCS